MNTPLSVAACVLAASVILAGEDRFSPARLSQPPTDSWPTFNGDYTGRRFSPLTQITSDNVHQLSLAWVYRLAGTGLGAIKSTPLQIDGVL
jgi:alcohol dehydrogenase (cytochrome c)